MDITQKKIDALMKVGAATIIDSTLSKLINIQIAGYKDYIKQISTDLKLFEKKYNMTSEECYNKFESGELGDGEDFFEWTGLYENILLYKDRIKMLEEAVKE